MDDNIKNTKIDTIPLDAEMTIKISGYFYKSIRHMIDLLLAERSEDAERIIRDMKELEETGQPKDMWEGHLMIYYALSHAIEESARTNNLLVKEPFSSFISDDDSPEASPES